MSDEFRGMSLALFLCKVKLEFRVMDVALWYNQRL